MATTWIVHAYCKTSGYAMRWPDAAAFHEPMARLGAAAQDDGGARDWEWLWVERHDGKAMRHHGWLRGTAHVVSTKHAVTHKMRHRQKWMPAGHGVVGSAPNSVTARHKLLAAR